MTNQEIEKAAERFTEERRHKSTGYPPKEWFKAGAEFADKYWQEKTRWIPVEERLPEHTKRVFIKNNIGNVCCGFYSKSAKMWHTDCEMHYFTHWKEIG